MTAKDKAMELVNKMAGFTIDDCKRNSTTCVDEILKELKEIEVNYDLDFGDDLLPYYEQVKKEIQLIS